VRYTRKRIASRIAALARQSEQQEQAGNNEGGAADHDTSVGIARDDRMSIDAIGEAGVPSVALEDAGAAVSIEPPPMAPAVSADRKAKLRAGTKQLGKSQSSAALDAAGKRRRCCFCFCGRGRRKKTKLKGTENLQSASSSDGETSDGDPLANPSSKAGAGGSIAHSASMNSKNSPKDKTKLSPKQGKKGSSDPPSSRTGGSTQVGSNVPTARSVKSQQSADFQQGPKPVDTAERHMRRLEVFLADVKKNPQRLANHVEKRRADKTHQAYLVG